MVEKTVKKIGFIYRFRKRTTANDLILWLTFTITIVATILATAIYQYSTFVAQKELKNKAIQTADELSKVIASPLWEYNMEAIRQITKAYLSSEYVEEIRLTTEGHLIFAEHSKKKTHNTFTIKRDVIIERYSFGQTEKKKAGEAELLISTEIIKHNQQAMLRAILIIIFSVLFIVISGTYLIMRNLLSKRINRLIDGIRKIAGGEYQHSLSSVPQSDINYIIQEINTMSGHIGRREKELMGLYKKLEESEDKYRQIFENAIEGIYQVTLDGRFISANTAMAKLHGYDSPDDLISSVTDITEQCYSNPEDQIEIGRILKTEDYIAGFEKQFKRKDNSLFWGIVSARSIRDKNGDLLYYEGSLIDITERKEKEHAVAEREAAKASTQAKSNFLANMSHEIRTPMNAIMGFNELALNTELDARQLDYLTKIRASSQTLLGVINDILDFSKIEAGKMAIESVDFNLDDVLNNVSNLLCIKAAEKGLEFLFDIDPNVPLNLVGDPLRLGQVLINLINNAVKFTEVGEIIVSTKVVSEDAGVPGGQVILKFSVIDTGIGLSQDQIKILFQPFSQSDESTTRRFGGTGLGLAICKQLVAMMGGEIGVESEPGRGSRFTFTAKFGRHHKEDDAYIRPLVEFKGMRVLVVDDNPASCKILGAALSSFSFEVNQAHSGKEAIAKIEMSDADNPYKIVLMDWKMPEMDGIETTKRIKEKKGLSNIPAVLMVTAYGREEVMQRAKEVDMDAFLIKPINRSVLFDTIMEILGHPIIREKTSVENKVQKFETLQNLRGAKILLVEDNKINQQVAVELLDTQGILVSVVHNGREAVEAIFSTDPESTFDAVLMDLQMPEMDGYEASQTIRANPRFNKLPIIAMTAHVINEEKEKCLNAGMNDHIAKPIVPYILFSTLAQWVTPDKKSVVHLPEKSTKETSTESEGRKQFPDSLAGIDIEAGLLRVNGNYRLLKKLLMDFYDDYVDSMVDVRAAVAKCDTGFAERIAHTIEGVAGNIGATHLHNAAREFNEMIQHGKLNDRDAVIDNFENALNQVMASIERLKIEKVQQSTAAPGDICEGVADSMAKPEQTLFEFARLLSSGDTDSQAFFFSIKKYLNAFDVQSQVQLLENQLNNFDYDDALETLLEIAGVLNISLNR